MLLLHFEVASFCGLKVLATLFLIWHLSCKNTCSGAEIFAVCDIATVVLYSQPHVTVCRIFVYRVWMFTEYMAPRTVLQSWCCRFCLYEQCYRYRSIYTGNIVSNLTLYPTRNYQQIRLVSYFLPVTKFTVYPTADLISGCPHKQAELTVHWS